jgi:hypothetical protein
MMARSARVSASSAKVPVVWVSKWVSAPLKRCAVNAPYSAVCVAPSEAWPANTSTEAGENKGVR